ncbi:hypothetical protein [Deinococcus aluminii]|uniref:DUF1049 domain-containing protein n=1 Tax=Deinococcus aluminii TaxID=1656885 RepID=A0ABP9XHI9_9DEIO
MNNLKRVLLFFGIVALIATAFLLAKDLIDLNRLAAVAGAGGSVPVFSPGREVLLTAGLALLSGLLLGMGLALHTRPRDERSPAPNRPRNSP